MSQRDDALLSWCRDWCDVTWSTTVAAVTPLLVEASQRRFFRLTLERAPASATNTLVAMSSPPDLENNDQFLELARVFGAAGLPVPEVFGYDAASGFFLMEDLGKNHFSDVYGTADEVAAIDSAIALIHRFHVIQSPSIPPYARARFEMELEIYTEWFLDRLCGIRDAGDYEASFARLVDQTQEQPQVTVHRDYHCRNLLFNDGRVGIVDFQDALHGPALYDLASLLHDCYHVFDEARIDRAVTLFRSGSQLDLPEPSDVRRWLDLTAVQRQLKAVGIFCRLHFRDSRSSHLEYVLPLLERLRRLTAGYAETRDLAGLLAEVYPTAESRLVALA